MKQNFKKRGQKLAKRWENFSQKASEGSKEHIQENLIGRLQNAKRVRLLILEWCLLIVVIISLALTQAFWYDQSYSKEVHIDGGAYIEGTIGKVNSLNPLFAATNSEKALSKLMFARLATVDYSGHIGLGLAASVVPDETGKVWTVTLKDDLKWSDGEPITIEDVLYTVNVTKDTSINTSYSTNFSGVKIATIDNTITFTLPTAYVDFPSTLDMPILPAHILADVQPSMLLEHSFSTNPVTSGAFTFNATQSNATNSSDSEKIIYLAANENYYRGKPMLNSFAIHTYDNNAQIIDALSSGEITATAELSLADGTLSTELVNRRQTTIANGVYAFLNTTSPALENVAVRQAIQKGIDMQAILSHLDDEEPLQYPILSSEIELSEYPTLPSYDFAAAKSEIANEANVKELSLATINTGYFPELIEEFADQLTKLGFTVETEIYEPGQEFLRNVVRQRAYDILIYEVELGPNPDLFAYYHSSQATTSGLNLSNYYNSLVDDLILSARTTMNEEARAAKYESFLRHWVNDVPAIGIHQASLTYYYHKNARAFSEDNRLVYATDRFEDIDYWAVNRAKRNRTP